MSMCDLHAEQVFGPVGEPTLFQSADEHRMVRVTDDGEGARDGLRYAVWSCNVVYARSRTLEVANKLAELSATGLGLERDVPGQLHLPLPADADPETKALACLGQAFHDAADAIERGEVA